VPAAAAHLHPQAAVHTGRAASATSGQLGHQPKATVTGWGLPGSRSGGQRGHCPGCHPRAMATDRSHWAPHRSQITEPIPFTPRPRRPRPQRGRRRPGSAGQPIAEPAERRLAATPGRRRPACYRTTRDELGRGCGLQAGPHRFGSPRRVELVPSRLRPSRASHPHDRHRRR
jgi:hypothetical protein